MGGVGTTVIGEPDARRTGVPCIRIWSGARADSAPVWVLTEGGSIRRLMFRLLYSRVSVFRGFEFSCLIFVHGLGSRPVA